MSKNSITRYTTLLFVLVVSAALVGVDLVVLAQNANSSTTTEEPTRGGTMTSQNDNTGNTGTTGRRRRRRGRRTSANANTAGDTTMTTDTSGNANTSGDTTMSGAAGTQTNANMGTSPRRRGRRRARTDMSGGPGEAGTTMTAAAGGEQTDLSGTYTGNVSYPEGGLDGPATLTITGNNFTITPEGGGSAVSGRVTAVTTRGYTGVTMMFGDTTAPSPTQNPPPPPLPAVSLRAHRTGDRVTLKSVPGERRQFSFSSGAAGGGRRRGRRSRAATSGTGMEGTSTTGTTGDMSGTTTTGTTTTGTGRRRGRRRGSRTGNINGNMNTNDNMGGNMNSNTTPPQ